MTQLIVEIHVPLVATEAPAGTTWPTGSATISEDFDYPWIFELDEYLAEREDKGEFAVYDEGEELGDAYVYFITGASETTLLGIAADVAALPGVPRGVFAMVTDDEAANLGAGRRVPLS